MDNRRDCQFIHYFINRYQNAKDLILNISLYLPDLKASKSNDNSQNVALLCKVWIDNEIQSTSSITFSLHQKVNNLSIHLFADEYLPSFADADGMIKVQLEMKFNYNFENENNDKRDLKALLLEINIAR